MTKEEIDIAISAINSVIDLIKQYDPLIEQNKVFIALTKVINTLKDLGL